MDLELLMTLSARIRALSEAEFVVLKSMVATGNENTQHLPAICECPSDCVDLTNAHNDTPRLRLVGVTDDNDS